MTKVKLTGVARRDLATLDPETRKQATQVIRSLKPADPRGKRLKLSGVKDNVFMARVTPTLHVVYRVTDTDEDGAPEVVLLQILDRDRARGVEPLSPALQAKSYPLRLGTELAEALEADY